MGVLQQLMSVAEAASSIIGSSLAQDVIRITDQDGNALFPSARIMRATVREEAVFFEHPLEDGNKVTDYKIHKPIEIQLAVIIPDATYGTAYNAIRNAFIAGTALIVQTKTGSYGNQYIQGLPHEETPEGGDSIALALTLREVEWFSPDIQTLPATEVAPSGKGATVKGKKVAAKPDASTVKQGQKTGTAVSAAQAESIGHKLSDLKVFN